MIWLQAGVCFLAWVAYGWWLRHRAGAWLARASAWPVRKRSVIGSLGLIFGGVLVVGALLGVAALDGIEGGTLSLWAWATVLIVGFAFVHLQSFAAVCLVSSALGRETGAPPGPSGQ